MTIPVLNQLHNLQFRANTHSVSKARRNAILPSGLYGHLVPDPPDIFQQHLPEWPPWRSENHPIPCLAADGDGNDGGTGDSSGDDETSVEESRNRSGRPTRGRAESLLFGARVIVPCEQKNDLCLNDEFRTEWHDRIEAIRDDETMQDELADEFDISPTAVEFEDTDEAFIAHGESRTVGHWESRAAMVAEVAAARELPDWVNMWDDISAGLRSDLLSTIRIFIDVCPLCDDSVTFGKETIESNAQSSEILTRTCEGCSACVFEMPVPEAI